MERIKLNLIPSGVAPIVHLSQYDDRRKFGIDLFEGESVYVLDGTETLTVNSRKPDGHVVVLTVTNTGTSSLDVDTVEQLTAVHGVSYAKLQIVKGSVTIATLPFLIDVSRDPLENGDPSESFIQNLRTQIADGVAEQYDSANVIFDNEPTENHGIGYTVTSEGIKTAIDNAFDYDNTASGSIVHITDGADNIPVKNLEVDIQYQQASGTPTPSSPLPITTFSEMNVCATGKNLAKFTDGYGINVSGEIVSSPKRIATLIPIKFGNSAITISFTSSESVTSDYAVYNNGVYVRRATGIPSGTTLNITDGDAIYFQIYNPSESASTNPITTSNTDCQVELGTSPTTYEPFGTTYNIPFGQTVGKGTLNVTTGELTITHIELKIKNTDNWYNFFVGTGNASARIDFTVDGYYNSGISNYNGSICSHGLELQNYWASPRENDTPSSDFGYAYIMTGTTLGLRVHRLDTTIADMTAFKNALPSEFQLVLKLATPQTIQLSATEVKTLLGENNIFSDCGDVEVNYYTNKADDILEFIDSEIDKKNGDNIPIEEGSADSIKDYIDNVSLSGLSDTDISSPSASQVLSFDGNNWVNTNQIVVKYEEKDIAFDSSGEGTLYFANGYILGSKDIPSDSLYIGYITYMAGTKTMVKGFNRSATSFDSTAIANTTRKIGIYYLDNIATQ